MPTPSQAATGEMVHGGRGAQTVPRPSQAAHGELPDGGRGAQRLPPITATAHSEAPPTSDSARGDPHRLNIGVDPRNKIITITNSGLVSLWELAAAIEEWPKTHDPSLTDLVEYEGIEPGKKYLRKMVLKNGWRLAAASGPVWFDVGEVTGRDKDGKSYRPVVKEGRPVIILDNDTKEDVYGDAGTDGDQNGDVNIEPLAANLTLTTSASAVDVTPADRRRAPPYRVPVETAEEIEEAARQLFASAPAVAIAEAKQAKAIAVALSIAVDDLRSNDPDSEAARAKDLLAKQVDALDRIIVLLESGGDTEAALQTYRELLDNLGREFLKVLSNKSAMKGLLAAAVLSAAAVAGAQLSWAEGSLITASIVGSEVVEAVARLWKGRKPKE
jgi:hypothetical protein